MSNNFEKLKEYLSSDEFKLSIKSLAEKIAREDDILKSQIERFHKKFGDAENFTRIVDAIKEKYSSDKYRDKWYSMGIEPPEGLFHYLFEYVKVYGRECTKNEWDGYGNAFSGDLLYLNGYYFNLMHGQGTVINITKEWKKI